MDNEEPLVVFMACGVDLVELHRSGERADRQEALLWHSQCEERVIKAWRVQKSACSVQRRVRLAAMCVRSCPSFEAVRKGPSRTCNAEQASQNEEAQAGHADSCELPANRQNGSLASCSWLRYVVVQLAAPDKAR